MKSVADLRVSTGSQDLANQKMAVLDYARQQRFTVDRFVEAQVSSRKDPAQRGIDDLLGTLAVGDRLIVSELSRLGRSLGQEIRMLLEKTISKASIAKIVGVSPTALDHFIRTRKLVPKASKGKTRDRRP
jgi:DNA invertase Pin-like site-specific DNA recombinase